MRIWEPGGAEGSTTRRLGSPYFDAVGEPRVVMVSSTDSGKLLQEIES